MRGKNIGRKMEKILPVKQHKFVVTVGSKSDLWF